MPADHIMPTLCIIHPRVPCDLLHKSLLPTLVLALEQNRTPSYFQAFAHAAPTPCTHTFFKPWNFSQHAQNLPEDCACPWKSALTSSPRSLCWVGSSPACPHSARTSPARHCVLRYHGFIRPPAFRGRSLYMALFISDLPYQGFST